MIDKKILLAIILATFMTIMTMNAVYATCAAMHFTAPTTSNVIYGSSYNVSFVRDDCADNVDVYIKSGGCTAGGWVNAVGENLANPTSSIIFDTTTESTPDGSTYCMKVGTLESGYSSGVFTIDNTNPLISISNQASGSWTNSDTIAVSVSDATSGIASTKYVIRNDATCGSGQDTDLDAGFSGTSVVANDEATYYNKYICFRTTDNAGHKNYVSSAQIAKLDTTSPTVNAGTDKTVKAMTSQNATASDGSSGIASYSWTKETGSGTIIFTSGTSEDTNISANADDSYTIRLTVTDNAGNSAYDTMNLVWDTTAPTTSGSPSGTAGTNFWYTSNVAYSITPTDATSGIASTYYCTDTTNACSPDISLAAITLSTAGNNYVRYSSTDSAGNTQTTQTSGLIKIDKVAPTAPTITFTSPEGYTSGSWSGSNVKFTLAGSTDATSGIWYYEYSINGGEYITYSGEVTVTAEGTTSLVVRAVDSAGNLGATSSATIKIDKTNPNVNAGIDKISRAVFTQDATASDGGAGIASYSWTKVSGPGTVTFGSNTSEDTTVSTNTDGTYVLRLTVTDSVGNSASDTMTLLWDTTVPTTYNNYDGSYWETTNPVSVTITERDPAVSSGINWTKYCIDTGNSCTPNIDITGGGAVSATNEGYNYIRYMSRDIAGNEQAVQNIEIHIDSVTPTIPDLSIAPDYNENNAGHNSKPVLTFTVRDSTSGIDTESISVIDSFNENYFSPEAADSVLCDPSMESDSYCTDSCAVIFNSDYVDTGSWYYDGGGTCNDDSSSYVDSDSTCDEYGIAGTNNGLCADWYNYDNGDDYYCPSYDRMGRAVTAADCTCLRGDGACSDYTYNEIFDLSNEFFAGAPSKLSCVANNEDNTDYTCTMRYGADYALPDGTYTFQVYTEDNAGNSESNAIEDYTIDTITPTISDVTLSPNIIRNGETLNVAASGVEEGTTIDEAYFTISGFDSVYQMEVTDYETYYGLNWSGVINEMPNGEYGVTVTVVDLAGNSKTSDSMTFVVSDSAMTIERLNALLNDLNASIIATDGSLTSEDNALSVNITALRGNITTINNYLTLLNTNDTTLQNRIIALNDSINALTTKFNKYSGFVITDTTSSHSVNTDAFYVSVTTGVSATCEIYDVLMDEYIGVMTGDNATHTEHQYEVNASITGHNVYRIVCNETVYGFKKSTDIDVRVLAMYAIDIPGNGVGLTTSFPGFLISNKDFGDINLGAAGELANTNISVFFNSTAGPTFERLNSADLKDGIVWRWDAGANEWTSYDLAEEDFNMSTSSLSYYKVHMDISALGKSIRHGLIEMVR